MQQENNKPRRLFLGEYESLSIIGKGAFATIRKVRHARLGYIRALKVLKDPVMGSDDPAYKAFEKECAVLLKIGNGSHPNIVHIYQPRVLDNYALVEMDFIDGQTINDYVAKQCKGFVPWPEWLRFAREIASALAYCHCDIYRDQMQPGEDNLERDPNDARKFIISPEKEKQLIAKYSITHNDLHSNNVMRRNRDGAYILLDFGLSIQDGQAVKSSQRAGGAPEYKSPEKWENDAAISTRSDIYSFGIMLFEMLAGQVPFAYTPKKYSNELAALNAISQAHLKQAPPAIDLLRKTAFEQTHPGKAYTRDFPKWAEDIIMKCLDKNPERRFQNAKELLCEIDRHAGDSLPVQPDIVIQNASTGSVEATIAQLKSDLLELRQKVNEQELEIKALKESVPYVVNKPPERLPNIFSVNGVELHMASIKGGSFLMGATTEQLAYSTPDEQPAHRVNISDFKLCATQVTQELWTAVMGSNPSSLQSDPKLPVDNVSWNDCQDFIARLNTLTGQRFRLPTEAEWEFAARGGNVTQTRDYIYAGSNNVGDVAWHDDGTSVSKLMHPVATKRPNELGLYDMSGNVWEWCQDWYDDNYYRNSPQTDPCNINPSLYRVLRGGNSSCKAKGCRVAYRANGEPGKGGKGIGLRIAL